jgi:ubiquinone/menaquinone biosynthesis C-methylase UbiE
VATAHFAKPEHARDYAEARALPRDTLERWGSIVADLVPRAGVHAVLDLGAGTGRFSALLADRFAADVVAVEPAWTMLTRREAARSDVRFVAGMAEALPLRTGGVDLAFLSMVYHHLADVSRALAELRRVVRPGGWVVARTSTREIVETLDLYEFFPEARELDRSRMPWRREVAEAFASVVFTPQAHTMVRQRFADNPEDWLGKIALRGLSSLQLLPEDVFQRRLAEFARYCRTAPAAPVWESVDLFVFQTR